MISLSKIYNTIMKHSSALLVPAVFLVPSTEAGSAKKLKMKRYKQCIGFDSLSTRQMAKLFNCNDSRVPTFRHSINTMRLSVPGTNLCLDDWASDTEIRLNTCSGPSSQRDQMWVPMYAGGGYAFWNLANDCVIDDINGPNIMCEGSPNSLNKDDFATSQVFIELGTDFID